jgi:hypothetical protein
MCAVGNLYEDKNLNTVGAVDVAADVVVTEVGMAGAADLFTNRDEMQLLRRYVTGAASERARERRWRLAFS